MEWRACSLGRLPGAEDANGEFHLGNWAAFLASTGLVAAAAVLGYALVRRIVWGPRPIFLTVPTLRWIPTIVLFAIVLIGVFVAGYLLVPGAVGAGVRNWFGWRF
jgi:hypothetical protein